MVYHGTIRNGVVELEPGATIPEGVKVRVEPVNERAPDVDAVGELSSFFLQGRDAVPTGMPDLATNLDHYLYGQPKVKDAG